MSNTAKPAARILIQEFGSASQLIAAFAALQTVDPKNFKMSADYGQPFKAGESKTNVVCNAAGWLAQHPHFKERGLSLETISVVGTERSMPVFVLPTGQKAMGYNAMAYALEMDAANCVNMLAPDYYPNGEKTTLDEVLARIKKYIGKAGGADSLKALLDSQKPPKPKKEKKIKPKAAKKAPKKAAKPVKKAAKPAKKAPKKAPAAPKKAAKKAPASKK